ncbi:MAG: proteasome subunit beta [Candidatus Woesearchaeota archaeon]|nr:proteasome subunit beta [Candidatus Woesearchaeota archaeon]
MDNTNVKKTGTTTIGIICKDGVVMAADKKATAGHMIVDKRTQKIHQVDDAMAVTIAGLVSDAQLLTKIFRAELKLKKIQSHQDVTVKQAANMLAGLSYYNIRKMSMLPGIVGFLLGGKDNSGYYLYNIGIDGSVTQEDDYSSDGSGSIFVYGVLEAMYKKDMSIHEGIALAKKALNAAVQRDSASGCGFDITTITQDGFKLVETGEIPYKIQ